MGCEAKTTLHEGWRGEEGGGAYLFLLDTMVAWRENENCIARECRLFCGGSEKIRFQWLHKEQFPNFLELCVGGRIDCFFNDFLILLGNRSRSESMRGFS